MRVNACRYYVVASVERFRQWLSFGIQRRPLIVYAELSGFWQTSLCAALVYIYVWRDQVIQITSERAWHVRVNVAERRPRKDRQTR
jgi:hypothetical protein